jgi:hypothetical protein
LALNAMAYEFNVQRAYKVKFAVCPCEYGKVIAVPPEVAVNHPTKV